jgi:TIR domain
MAAHKQFDVFLSYASKDHQWVSEFASALQTHGVETWFDAYNIAPGDKWQERIQEALRQSNTLVLILSSNNLDKPWTFFEVGAAIADRKRIIPILLEDVDIQHVPPLLRQFQHLKEPSPQEAGKRVAEVIEKAAEKA